MQEASRSSGKYPRSPTCTSPLLAKVEMKLSQMAGQQGWGESGKVSRGFTSLDEACGYRDFLYDRVFDCTGATPGKG